MDNSAKLYHTLEHPHGSHSNQDRHPHKSTLSLVGEGLHLY
ncbi:uncharacterized protein METZ01_LOCUS183675 [marine metagenome]|uniref:Uncharacterized protein n=1 Tax=marine metagenome TaxID=408172 RepID=A0A382CZB4_9ZZZZ